MRRWFWPTNVAMRPTVAKNAFEKMLFVIKNAFFVLPKIHSDAHRGLIALNFKLIGGLIVNFLSYSNCGLAQKWNAHRGLIAAGSSGAHRVKFPSSSGGSSLVSFLI